MKHNRKRNAQAGITLIEMLVVVTIIALFAALVGPRLFGNVDKAKRTAAKAQITNFMTALGSYKLDTGTFPTTEQGLNALRVKPENLTQWAGYAKKTIPKLLTAPVGMLQGMGKKSFCAAETEQPKGSSRSSSLSTVAET